jgi:polyhydroxyalkanoate synthesis regulator phasin
MITVRDGIEQAVLISIGAAAMTRERAEAAVADLVRRGQIGSDEGKRVVDRLTTGVRGAEGSGSRLVGRMEGGVRSALREVGVVTRSEHDDLVGRLAELEHRIALLERPGGALAPEGDDTSGGPGTQ